MKVMYRSLPLLNFQKSNSGPTSPRAPPHTLREWIGDFWFYENYSGLLYFIEVLCLSVMNFCLSFPMHSGKDVYCWLRMFFSQDNSPQGKLFQLNWAMKGKKKVFSVSELKSHVTHLKERSSLSQLNCLSYYRVLGT